MGKRGPKPQFDRAMILSHAQDLVVNDGLAGLTITRLARRLNTSPSALYRYVSGKEAIILALQEQAIGRLESRLREELERVNEFLQNSPVDRRSGALVRALTVFYSYALLDTEDPTSGALLKAFLSSPEPVLEEQAALKVNETLASVLALAAQCLDAAVSVAALGPGDAMMRTHVLWAGLHGLSDFEKRDRLQPDKLKVKALRFTLLESLFTAWGAPAGALAAALAQVVR